MDCRVRSCVVALVALTVLSLATRTDAQSPTVGNYVLVSQRAVTRTVYEFTYRGVLTNPGPALTSATATVASTIPATTVIEGSLSFGPVPAGGTATSLDTFTIQHNRAIPFSTTALSWTIVPVTGNAPPVAVIAPPGPAFVGLPVLLNGSGSSDPNGAIASFSWTLTSRPTGSLAALGQNTPTALLIPDRPGTYVVQLVVSDGTLTGQASVSITTVNRPPVAVVVPLSGPVLVGNTVALSGVGSSDPDGDALTHAWSLTTRPAGSTATLNATTPATSVVPDRPGTYVVTLTVSDGQLSASATLSFHTTNSPPRADAGPDRTSPVGAIVTLNGSGSTDIDGDVLTMRGRCFRRLRAAPAR